jgi:hypothetical protein
MTYLKVPYSYIPGRTEENHKFCRSGCLREIGIENVEWFKIWQTGDHGDKCLGPASA